VAMIRAFNHLRGLGKPKAIAALRKFLKLSKSLWQN
jgi:hypothetical protein